MYTYIYIYIHPPELDALGESEITMLSIKDVRRTLYVVGYRERFNDVVFVRH